MDFPDLKQTYQAQEIQQKNAADAGTTFRPQQEFIAD